MFSPFPPTVAATAHAPQVRAQMTHDHAGHADRMRTAPPTLPGDDTFGAIAEIVAILEANDKTDWSQIKKAALRRHLLDMNAVTTGPAPQQNEIAGGLEMTIATTGQSGAAAASVVHIHAPCCSRKRAGRPKPKCLTVR